MSIALHEFNATLPRLPHASRDIAEHPQVDNHPRRWRTAPIVNATFIAIVHGAAKTRSRNKYSEQYQQVMKEALNGGTTFESARCLRGIEAYGVSRTIQKRVAMKRETDRRTSRAKQSLISR